MLIDTLEPRRLLSASSLRDSTLRVIGEAGVDNAITVTLDGSELVATVNGEEAARVEADGIKRVILHGRDGNDTLTVDDSILAVARPDRAEDGEGGDISWRRVGMRVNLSGGGGDDTLTGFGGLHGGPGNDTMNLFARGHAVGSAGNDTISGSDARDAISGGRGDDDLSGNGGNDWLIGGIGNDRLDGGDGDDVLSAGRGDDVLIGGADADFLWGGLGLDSLDAGGDEGDEERDPDAEDDAGDTL